MIVRAHWYLYPPAGPRTDERKVLVTETDVDELLDALGREYVDDAYLTSDQPNAFVLYLAVRDDWGYLAWSDDEFVGSPVGHPQSPGTHGTFNTDYFPGTGLPVETVAPVLAELLATGRRSTGIAWVSDDELEQSGQLG